MGCLQETADTVPALIQHPTICMVKLRMKVFQLLQQLDRSSSLRPCQALGLREIEFFALLVVVTLGNCFSLALISSW